MKAKALKASKYFVMSIFVLSVFALVNGQTQVSSTVNSASFMAYSVEYRPEFPVFSFKAQYGYKQDYFMIRVGVESHFFASLDGAFIYSIAETGLSVYGGLGLETLFLATIGLYGNVGLELKVDDLAFFFEFQPNYLASNLSPDTKPLGKFRVGLNVYF